ncbi:MAG: trypsin-like peptidase domain-containing protein [Oligoflexus sp.]
MNSWQLATILYLLYSSPLLARVYHSFADVAEKAIPGVVNIRTTQIVTGRQSYIDPYQFFLKGRLPSHAKNHSLGSGVIVDRKGYVVTNYHVVEGATTIDILFADRKQRTRGTLIGMDRKTDLALLKINPQPQMVPLDFGDSDRLRVGDIVLAIGNPFGFAHTVTSGIISAKGRVIGTGPYDSFLQTDAPVNPGNSGGPLIDVRGRVIGINTAVSADGPGISFAIPINIVKEVIADLIKHGKVIRPWLGVVGRNIISQDDVGDDYDPTGVYGVLVENLIVDGPSYGAGLRIGDLIMGMDGKKIYDLHQMQRELSRKSPADRVQLKIYRRRHGFLTINVPLTEIPRAQDLPEEKDLF